MPAVMTRAILLIAILLIVIIAILLIVIIAILLIAIIAIRASGHDKSTGRRRRGPQEPMLIL